MTRSMTAYGRAARATPIGRWVVEIHSVNRKMLDLMVNLPREMLRFDIPLRKRLSEQLQRGKVTARVFLQAEETEASVLSHLPKLKSLKTGWEKLAKELGYQPGAIDLKFLMGQLERTVEEELWEGDGELLAMLEGIVDEALKDLMKMKEREGENLARELELILKGIEGAVETIASRSQEPIEKFRQRLLAHIEEVKKVTPLDEERVQREIIIFSEKFDISEEIARLKSHISQFRVLLSSKEKSVGRSLDFLTQELNREINTIAAKTADGESVRLAVHVKGEVEKIREQVQNIE